MCSSSSSSSNTSLLCVEECVAENPATDPVSVEHPLTHSLLECSQDFSEPGPSGNSLTEPDPIPPSMKLKIRRPMRANVDGRIQYRRERMEMRQKRSEGRAAREEQCVDIQRAILKTLQEIRDQQQEANRNAAQLTEVIRRYTEFHMTLSGMRF